MYRCDGQTSFFLDSVNHGQSYRGSSMAANHQDVLSSGKVSVQVPMVNMIKGWRNILSPRIG